MRKILGFVLVLMLSCIASELLNMGGLPFWRIALGTIFVCWTYITIEWMIEGDGLGQKAEGKAT